MNEKERATAPAVERVQLRRTKGWKMPANTVTVARPSRWGNPFKVTAGCSAAEAVAAFRARVESDPLKVAEIRENLKGKNLACWCAPDQPCHADVLLEIANA